MKKLIALILIAIMAISLVACDNGNEKTPDDTKNGEVTTTEGNDDNNNNNNDNNNNNNNNDNDSVTQAAMEAELLKRLSAISSLKSLTLCGGDKITYLEDGLVFAGDTWTIENPKMSKDEFVSSVKSQLTAAGFTENEVLFGTDYVVKAGPGTIGVNIWYQSEEKEILIRTTNFRDEYSTAFIEAENAKLPTVIEYVDIIDRLPENFSISYTTNLYRYVVCRYNGGYYVESEDISREKSSDYEDYRFINYDVAVPDGNGGYTYYHWKETVKPSGTEKDNVTVMEKFCGSSNAPIDVVKNYMSNLSEWGRMCWEYNGSPVDVGRFVRGMSEYSMSKNVTKNGTETFAGRNCEKVHCEPSWIKDGFDIVFDLETGMTMKLTTQAKDSEEVNIFVEVTEYNTAPTSLGTFVQP